MANTKQDMAQLCLGAISKQSEYSTHFDQNFNVDGSPSSVDLENIFNAPQDNIDNIIGYAKYCYRKHGIITRVVNIVRDFGTTDIKLDYPSKNKKIKKCIEEYNERIDIQQLVSNFIFELALTGNLACYDRNGKRVDIYPINLITPIPLVVDNKQMIAYNNENTSNFSITDYGEDINSAIENAYPEEILKGIKEGKQTIPLSTEYAYFAKINASQYESYGTPIILPAFEDLAHKSLLKEAEKATANDIIDKVMLVKIGDADNKPSMQLINQYNNLLNGLSGSVRLTVPYYVDAMFVEPQTKIFGAEKFVEIDTDILNTLGVSLSLIRGESGGNYSEGIINFSGLVRTIESIQRPIAKIIHGLYVAELKRNGLKSEDAPKVSFSDVVIDKETKLNLIKELFTTAGLPYRVLYEEAGFDFDSIKLVREEENEEGMDETFKIHSMPFSGNQDQTDGVESQDLDDKGGRPKKTMTERKTDKTTSNNSQPRTNLQNTNRSA